MWTSSSGQVRFWGVTRTHRSGDRETAGNVAFVGVVPSLPPDPSRQALPAHQGVERVDGLPGISEEDGRTDDDPPRRNSRDRVAGSDDSEPACGTEQGVLCSDPSVDPTK